MDSLEVKWEAPEYVFYDKDVGWYWVSIILAVLVLAAAIWQRNFLFGFFVVVAEILILVWGARSPRRIGFAATEKGLTIGGRKFYPWGEIEDFSLGNEEEWPDVIFRFKQRFRPTLKIHLSKESREAIVKTLRTFVREVEREETLTDLFEKFFRF